MKLEEWRPKSLQCLTGYTKAALISDIVAGVTVGLVALPLAMAFGIASGVSPQAGIYTAVVAGFLISALGGSRTQIGGPTGAFVVIVIAAMDAGRTEEIAKGMAWLILAVVALGPDSPLTALSNVANGVKDKATGHAHQVTSAPTQQGGPSA